MKGIKHGAGTTTYVGELTSLHEQVGELQQEVTKLTLLVKRLQSDLFDHPWKKSGHPWNQVRNPRHLPK